MRNLLEPPNKILVSAVIPTFNSEIDIERLLKSFELLDWPKEYLEIIVVDNNSSDQTVQIVEKYFSLWKGLFHSTKLIQNISNVGAASAYNIGIHNSSYNSVYIWKLDSDVALTPKCLTALLSVIINNEQIGAVASNYILPNGVYGNVISVFYRRPRRWLHPMHSHSIENSFTISQNAIVGLHGASVLFNKNAIKAINNFDIRFFLYYDDTDISYVLKKNKYEILCVEESKIYHFIKNKEGINAERAIYYFLRSQLYFCDKHFSAIDFVFYITLQILFFPWLFLRVCNSYKINSYTHYKLAFFAWMVAWKDFAINYFGIYRK